MDFRFKDVPKSAVSEFSFSAMFCCIITSRILYAMHHGELTRGAFMLITVEGILFLGWLIRLFYMYIGGRKVITMPRRPAKVVENISCLLLVLWILTGFIDRMCRPVWAVVSWVLWIFAFGYYLYFSSRYGKND